MIHDFHQRQVFYLYDSLSVLHCLRFKRAEVYDTHLMEGKSRFEEIEPIAKVTVKPREDAKQKSNCN